jgi:sulfate/thiosulfate transport system permease protein
VSAAAPGHGLQRSRRRVVGATEPRSVQVALIASALGFVALVLLAPLGLVFVAALSKGVGAYVAAVGSDETRAAIQLSLLAAGLAVPLNTVFGIAAAWLLTHYEFPGKRVLVTLVDLPFSVSPVIAGLVFVLLFGANGWLGPWLMANDVKVIFAVPGIVLATVFVTFPMVAREVLTVMQAAGNDEEQAALTLGASGWQVLWHVTLPKVRSGVLYGVILCTARALGEFGAVSVVSGHIRGRTNTVPLQVEILYNEYDHAGAFAVASLLALVSVSTLVLKELLAAREARRRVQVGGEATP